mgnify:CR=1 FL=1
MARETTYGAAIPENIRADQAGLTRRTLTRGMAVGALVVTINGLDIVMTPREARAANAPLKTLTPVEAAALEAVAETILPGAKAAGIVPFVDHHLSVPPGECLLAVRLTGSAHAATLLVNVLGCLVAGLLVGVADKLHVMSNELRLFLFTGILGGFTTFSAFASESLELLNNGNQNLFIVYTLSSLIIGIAALGGGLMAIRLFIN